MNAAKCPAQSALEELVRGQVSSTDATEIERHMLECDRCATIADQIVSSTEITAMLTRADTGIFRNPEAETVERLIQRAHSMTPGFSSSPAQSNASEQTLAGDGDEASTGETLMPGQKIAGSGISFEFLNPAQLPDEIGRLGGYRILEVLGSGGMGVVFRSEDPGLKRRVALKVMKPTIAGISDAKLRFLKEAEATAAIEHDNIVTIYQVGEDNGVPFIAMQLLKGESLQARLNRVERLPESDVLRIGREVAEGLQAAHSRGLIHRDIKPDNIWLQEGNDRVRIVDFGLVRNCAEDSGLTRSGIVLGTPNYMAPEQARSEKVDHRCDLFSLGNVLYRLVSGKAPFEGSSLPETWFAVVHEDPKPLTEVAPDVNPQLADLITRLLSKDREQRPQSAEAVAEELRRLSVNRATSTIEPQPIKASNHRQPPKRNTLLGVLGGFAALLRRAVFVIKQRILDGTVIMELESPVQLDRVEVDGHSVVFVPNDVGTVFTLSVPKGTHSLVLKTTDGIELATSLGAQPIEISAGKTHRIRAWLVESTADVASNEGNINSRQNEIFLK